MKTWMKSAALGLAAAVIVAGAAFAASAWEGVWKVSDSAGQPFEITLSADGKAKASLHEEMVGTWKDTGDSAVISWQTGWTTKISKSESGDFRKTAYRKGEPLTGAPSNSSDAQKVK